MAGEINVDIQQVQTAASDIARAQQTINGLVEEAGSCVQALNWEGNAAANFKTAFSNMQSKFANANTVINQYVTFLQDTAETYLEVESTRAADNSSYEGGN